MEVNENYYGLKENWFPLGGTSSGSAWQNQIPEDEKFKLANFLNNTQQKLQSDRRNGMVLGNAIYKAYKTDSEFYDPTFEATLMGKVFDPSIEFAGMAGDYCPYSRIMYYSNRREQDQGSTRELVNEGEELINVWNYFYTSYIPTYTQGYGNYTRSWDDFYVNAPSSPSGTYGYEFTAMRWLPGNPQDSSIQIGSPSSAYPYYVTSYATRNELTFVTQFPCRRTVLVPTVTCSDDALNPTNVRTYDLYTYLNQYKETRPIVWSIQVEIYTKAGASDLPTSSDKRGLRNTMMMASNTPLSLPFRGGSPYVKTMAAGGTLVNEDNPFMAPQIIPTASNQTPIGGPINAGLGASTSKPDWSVSGGNGTDTFDVWAVINCGKLEFNNWTSRIIGGGTACRCYCNAADYSKTEFREAVRHATACFGMFFTDSAAYAETAQLDDDTMHLGVLENGIGYGKYTSGEKNTEQPQFGWKTMNESDYNPDTPPTPPTPDAPTEDDPYSWNTAGTNGANSFRHIYLASFLNIKRLYDYISNFMNIDTRQIEKGATISSTTSGTEYHTYTEETLRIFEKVTSLNFTSDPLSCIVDIIMYPFDIPDKIGTSLGEIEAFKLGYGQTKGVNANENFGLELTAVGGRPINGNTIAQIDLGSEMIIPKFGDFRDYKPYTTIEITIPYHGTVEIDSAEFMSSRLGVIINVDVCTGLSVAYITKNGAPRISIPGNMGIHIPISGVNAQNYYNQMVQRGTEIANTKIDKTKATVGMYGSVFSGAMIGAGIGAKLGTVVPGVGNAAGAIIGGSVGAINGLIKGSASYDKTSNNLKAQEYQYEHMQVSPTQVTNYSSELNVFEMPQCRITYHRCIMNSSFNPTSYGYSVGWATNKSGTVGSFIGYAKFSNAIIVGTMTEEEKALILEKLQDGVIIRES